MWAGSWALAGHLSAWTKEAKMLSFRLSSFSGLSNSRMAPRFRTITRSALRMVCTRCWGAGGDCQGGGGREGQLRGSLLQFGGGGL